MKNNIRVFSVLDLLEEGYDKKRLTDAFVQINKEAWPPPFSQDAVWTQEMVEKQIANCAHLLYCAFIESRMIGTLSIMYIDEQDALKSTRWEVTSGYGTLDTHNENGDTVFGLDLSVIPEFRGLGVSQKLAETAFIISVVLSNKKGCFLGARIPMYYKYSKSLSVEEYVFNSKDERGKALDPEIRLYLKDGFRIIKIISDYIEDPESLNYGVLMFWPNPLYKFTRPLPLRLLKPLAKKILLG